MKILQRSFLNLTAEEEKKRDLRLTCGNKYVP